MFNCVLPTDDWCLNGPTLSHDARYWFCRHAGAIYVYGVCTDNLLLQVEFGVAFSPMAPSSCGMLYLQSEVAFWSAIKLAVGGTSLWKAV